MRVLSQQVWGRAGGDSAHIISFEGEAHATCPQKLSKGCWCMVPRLLCRVWAAPCSEYWPQPAQRASPENAPQIISSSTWKAGYSQPMAHWQELTSFPQGGPTSWYHSGFRTCQGSGQGNSSNEPASRLSASSSSTCFPHSLTVSPEISHLGAWLRGLYGALPSQRDDILFPILLMNRLTKRLTCPGRTSDSENSSRQPSSTT